MSICKDMLWEQILAGKDKVYSIFSKEYITILADMNKHDVVCIQYYGKYKTILTEMEDLNDIRMESTLFSVPETNYLNYMLNRSEYSNGRDLQNKYILC